MRLSYICVLSVCLLVVVGIPACETALTITGLLPGFSDLIEGATSAELFPESGTFTVDPTDTTYVRTGVFDPNDEPTDGVWLKVYNRTENAREITFWVDALRIGAECTGGSCNDGTETLVAIYTRTASAGTVGITLAVTVPAETAYYINLEPTQNGTTVYDLPDELTGVSASSLNLVLYGTWTDPNTNQTLTFGQGSGGLLGTSDALVRYIDEQNRVYSVSALDITSLLTSGDLLGLGGNYNEPDIDAVISEGVVTRSENFIAAALRADFVQAPLDFSEYRVFRTIPTRDGRMMSGALTIAQLDAPGAVEPGATDTLTLPVVFTRRFPETLIALGERVFDANGNEIQSSSYPGYSAASKAVIETTAERGAILDIERGHYELGDTVTFTILPASVSFAVGDH